MIKKLDVLTFPVLLAVGLTVAFSLLVLTGVAKEFTNAGLEGQYFSRYYVTFLLVVWSILVTTSLLGSTLKHAKLLTGAGVGALAGYFSGFISVILVDLLKPGGWSLVLQQSAKVAEWEFRLVYPILSLNWLIGLAGTAVAIAVQNVLTKRGRPATE